MKQLTKIEKSKIFWYLLFISVLFFLLRLPSLIEPNWYGDEGIYQVIGMAIAKGRLLYSEIWDNKPPLLYLTYAIFSGDQFLVRLLSLKIGLLSTWAFYYLSTLLFRHVKASAISTFFFVLLFATPILEGNIANAENFILLPVISAGVLVYIASTNSQNMKFLILKSKFSILMTAGALLGVAFLYKIVGLFDFTAFSLYLFIVTYSATVPERSRLTPRKNLKIKLFLANFFPFLRGGFLPLFLGFITPITITSLYFMSQNAFRDFTQAVFFSNVGYVGYGNKLIIPQGLLLLKLFILSVFSFAIFWKRKHLTSPVIFVSVWLAFSFFSTYFSNRSYTHYALLTIPSVCLLIGLIYAVKKPRQKYILLLILILCTLFLRNTFNPNYKKSIRYYGNAVSFLTGNKNVDSYQSFFDHKTPRDYEIASFLKTHTTDSDNVFIWGDSAQIYTLSGLLPPGKYTVSYHIRQYRDGLVETQAAISKSKPKYIVTLPESKPLQFYLPKYVNRFVLRDAVIYERTF